MTGELLLVVVVPIFPSFSFMTEVTMLLTKYATRQNATNLDAELDIVSWLHRQGATVGKNLVHGIVPIHLDMRPALYATSQYLSPRVSCW